MMKGLRTNSARIIFDQGYGKGFREAIEKAAEVVYKHSEGKWGASLIIDELRALIPPSDGAK